MKTMVKKMMIAKDQLGHIVAERDIMVDSNNSYLVTLYYAFQVYVSTFFLLNEVYKFDKCAPKLNFRMQIYCI